MKECSYADNYSKKNSFPTVRLFLLLKDVRFMSRRKTMKYEPEKNILQYALLFEIGKMLFVAATFLYIRQFVMDIALFNTFCG